MGSQPPLPPATRVVTVSEVYTGRGIHPWPLGHEIGLPPDHAEALLAGGHVVLPVAEAVSLAAPEHAAA